jgi:hypothetical protein
VDTTGPSTNYAAVRALQKSSRLSVRGWMGGCAVPFRQNPEQNGGSSMPEAFVITPVTRPAPHNVVGEQITVLASGSKTGGYEIFRQAGPEGLAGLRRTALG